MKIYRLTNIIIVVIILLGIGITTVDAAQWWDQSRQFRMPVTVGAAGYDRVDKPVEMNINFTQLLRGLGQTGTLDEDSIRVIETDNVGAVSNSAVQFQLDKDLNFDPTNTASGTIVFIMDGTTQANKNRYYYIYFGLTGGSYVPISVTPLVTLTDNIIDENQLSYKIKNIGGTYYFQKQAGGFSSLNDISGNDWISYNSIVGDSGTYRGIPNAVYAEGIFHPGFTCCISDIISQGPIRIKIRSATNDGKWKSIWDFYPRYAKMTMTNVNHNYWLLYEGTPGGLLEPNTDFVVRSNGVKTLLSQDWYNDILNNEWLYFSDPNVGNIGRSLFFAHHEDDTIQDAYWQLSNMTVFGFGRDGPTALLSSVPQRLTIGLLEGTNFSQNSKNIYSAYKDLTIVTGNAEKYNDDNGDIRLTYDSSNDRQPSWSPDGQYVAFTSTRNGNWEIYKIMKEGEGSGVSRLTNFGGFDLEPAWAPNNRILFSRGYFGFEDVYVMDDNGGNVQQLTSETDFDEYPDWSPDGKKIVYSSAGGIVGGAKQLWIMNSDGTDKHKISDLAAIQPSWSPDGTKIAFKCYLSGNNICVINPDGSGMQQLTFDSANTHDPDWSPDGKRIVYASNKDGDWEIYVMNADGSNKRQLTSNNGIDDNYPVWSPDGQWIAYSSNRLGNDDIWLMNVGGGQSPNLSIITMSPTNNNINTITGSSQTFSIILNKNADITWFIDNVQVSTDTGTTSSYTNSTAGVGIYNVNVVAINGSETVSRSWKWTVKPVPILKYVPPIPLITNTTSNFWINFTLKPGNGNNKTDGYNVSIGGNWINGTTYRFNNSVGPHGQSNIIAFAYNNSGNGSLSEGYAISNVKVPNNIPVQTLIGDKNVIAGDLLTFTVSATDTDYDQITYGTNATKGMFDSMSGIYSWIPEESDVGEYIWYFNSSDDYDGVAIETMTVTVSSANIPLSIVSSPLTDPITVQDTEQTFSIILNKNADITWFIDNVQVSTDTGTTSSYTNSTAGVGIYNVNVVAINGSETVSRSWKWTIKLKSPINYIPPKPINLQNETGNFWANYSWSPGSGKNKTDLYNISINNKSIGNIAETYVNVTSTPHGSVNITIFAYNLSGTGSFSIENINGNVQIPNNPPLVIAEDKEITAGNLLTFTVAKDIDNDILTYSTNATKGSVDMVTGIYSWQTNGSDIGTYTWYFNSSDNYGGIANKTITMTVKQGSTGNGGSDNGGNGNSGSGGGGGGGGGGGSNENYSNIDVNEREELFIYKDTMTSYPFNDKRNPIVFINITGNTNAGEITATVETLKGRSSILKTDAPGVIYKNVNIWVGTSGFALRNNIKSATILFRVENSWLDKNKVKYDDIKMANWNGNNWTIIDTTKKMSNGVYTYFEISVDKFSYFAITMLKEKSSDTKNIDIAKPKPTDTQRPKKRVNQTDEGLGSAKGMPGFDVITTIILLLVSCIARRLYRMNDRYNEKMI